jgi:hypothetical protein
MCSFEYQRHYPVNLQAAARTQWVARASSLTHTAILTKSRRIVLHHRIQWVHRLRTLRFSGTNLPVSNNSSSCVDCWQINWIQSQMLQRQDSQVRSTRLMKCDGDIHTNSIESKWICFCSIFVSETDSTGFDIIRSPADSDRTLKFEGHTTQQRGDKQQTRTRTIKEMKCKWKNTHITRS